MLSIIAHHFSVHGGFNFPTDSITLNRLWAQFLLLGGSLGNNIFVMLSGYFLINSKGLNFRRMLNLWLRMLFYAVIIYFLFVTFGDKAFSVKSMLKTFRPVTRSPWWFPATYFVMYLIHPYVNMLLHSFSQEDYKKFLLTIGLYWSIIPMVTDAQFEASNLIVFVCLYSLAGYIRLWGQDLGSKKYILYGAMFVGLTFLTVVVLDVIGLKYQYFAKRSGYFHGMLRPFNVLAALCLLLGFKSLHLPYSKAINTFAFATFGVYMLHDHDFTRKFLWLSVFRNASYQDSMYLIPYSLAVIVIVYLVCTMIELLRSKLFRTLSRGKLS